MSYYTDKPTVKRRVGKALPVSAKRVKELSAENKLKVGIKALQKLLKEAGQKMLQLEQQAYSIELNERIDVSSNYKARIAELETLLEEKDKEIFFLKCEKVKGVDDTGSDEELH